MNKLLIFLVLGQFLSLPLWGQFKFHCKIDTTYFKGQYVSKVSLGLDSNVWVIKNANGREIGMVNTSAQAVDLSSSFQAFTLAPFTTILALYDTVLVGTSGDYITRYLNGNFTRLDKNYGLQSSNINSLVYASNTTTYFNFTHGVMVGTDSGLFLSPDFTYYYRNNYSWQNPKPVDYLEHTARYVSPDYIIYDVDTIGAYLNGFSKLLVGISYLGTYWNNYSPNVAGEVVNSVVVPDVSYNWADKLAGSVMYWGSNNGVKKKLWSGALFVSNYLPTTTVHKLYEWNYFPQTIFQDYYLFVGTDNGVYCLRPDSVYGFAGNNDSLALVPATAGLRIFDIAGNICDNSLWLATDQGLVRLLLNYTPTTSFNQAQLAQSLTPQGAMVACQGKQIAMYTYSGFNYQWLRNGDTIPSAHTNAYTADSSGSYQVVLKNNFCNYHISDTSVKANITISSIPTPVIKYPTQPICMGDTIKLQADSGAYTIYWYDNGIEMVVDKNKSEISVNSSGKYSIIYTDTNNCSRNSVVFPLTFNPLPILSIDASKSIPICEGESVMLKASASSGSNISWSGGENGSTITVSNASVYTAIASSHGCSVTDSINVIVSSLPIVSLSDDSAYFCEGELQPLSLKTKGGYSKYLWDNSVTSSDSSYSVYKAGLHTVKVYNNIGCINSDSIFINNDCIAFFIPNVFTPNSDSLNQTFFIKNLLPQCSLSVYDRWGGLVYQNNNYANNWDGTGASDGVYYYNLKSNYYGKEWKGWVEIVR